VDYLRQISGNVIIDMKGERHLFRPRYSITNDIAQNLMIIQRAATIVDELPLPSSVLKNLQRQSRETTVILSTKIEGNRLDERSKREAMYSESHLSEGQEVHNLMRAIEFLEQAEERQLPITEELVKKLHAIIQVIHVGRRPRVSEYRTEQNQVGRRHEDGFYLPPEPQDVPGLMEDLVAWINEPATFAVPGPIKAGVFLYQFLTIHPYMDGNGRTGRMLATYILRRAGLGLKGLFILESYYDRHLKGYYQNLQLGLSHNYYMGRSDPDMTPWIEFFVRGLAEVFQDASQLVEEKSREYTAVEPDLLRTLDPKQRIVFTQLAFRYNWVSTTDLRNLLDLSDRTIRDKVKTWIQQGFLAPRDLTAERIRSVTLGAGYQELALQIRAEPDRYRYLLK
jgi:Fic family protein